MPILTLIRGLPGSGKSTYAKENYHCLILEADMFFEKNGGYKYDPSLSSVAHGWCKSAMQGALVNGMDVAVTGTFVKNEQLEDYIQVAKTANNDVTVNIIRMTTDYGTIHRVPESVLARMRDSFESNEFEKIV